MNDRKFKILMTTDTLGGVWNYSVELASVLAGKGCEVALASMGNPLSKEQLRDISSLKNVTLYQSEYQLEWMDDPWKDVDKSSEWLLNISKEIKPDIVHLNTYSHGNIQWNAPTLLVAHSCVLSWWKSVKGENAPQKYTIYKERVEKGINNADFVVAPSLSMIKNIKANYRVPAEIKIIYNGRNPEKYKPGKKSSFYLTSGRIWDEAKNISLLTSIADKLPWKVQIAGDNLHPVTKKQVEFSNVNILGKLSQDVLARVFSTAPVYVLPAKYEPFGLSILEAALSGCAIVAGNIDSLREIWEDSIIYVSPDDPEELENILKKLSSDENVLSKYSYKALKHAQYYNSEIMVENYLSVYSYLAEKVEEIL
jgi:glycogen synthase